MGAAIGIDLGTTNTVVAISRDGQATVLPDETGAHLLPSVVSFHPDGRLLVGREARKRRVIDAPNTIHSVKRLIGRAWGSAEVEKARGGFAFELREGPRKQPVVVARGAEYGLPSISALVVGRAKEIAEAALGEPVDRAVVTVPASFDDRQRSATRKAAKDAGLEVLRILNEPTAAALAYGMAEGADERFAVYDFGGGTFDLTILDVADGVVEVLATAGDSFLGGDDVDAAIEGQIARAVLTSTRIDPRGSVEIMALVRAAAEHLKIQLSNQEVARVDLRAIGHVDGRPVDFQFELTRTQLERLAKPYVDRTLAVCEDALRLSRLSRGDLSSVILVGGSTRMPIVQERVEAFFGRTPRVDWNPDEVVAAGAAILASILAGDGARPRVPPPAPRVAPSPASLRPPRSHPPPRPPAPPPPRRVAERPEGAPNWPGASPMPQERVAGPPSLEPPPPFAPHLDPVPTEPPIPTVPSVFPAAPEAKAPLLVDVTPLTLGIEVVGGYVDRIIARNTAVPVARTRRFTTGRDRQTELRLRVCQGEDEQAAGNVALGELVLEGLRPMRRGELWVEVTFELDADGILQVRARDEGTGHEVATSMQIGEAR